MYEFEGYLTCSVPNHGLHEFVVIRKELATKFNTKYDFVVEADMT
jgi:hypothetical protein